MRFAFTRDQELLRDALRDVLKRECPASLVRASWERRDAADSLQELDFSARRLHWLKNVPEPVSARLAARPEPAPLSARMERLRRPRRPSSGFGRHYSEVTG